jgi:hypothetical protein
MRAKRLALDLDDDFVDQRPERFLAIRLEPLGGDDHCGELCGLKRVDEGFCDGVVDLNAADTEAIDAAALDQRFAGAMISGSRVASAIVGVQAASAMAAAGEPCRRAPPSLTAPELLCGWDRVFWARRR